MASKYFSIFNHQGNISQNYIEGPPHPSQNGYHQENKNQQMPARVQENRNSYAMPLWRSVWRFLKKLKIEFHMI
jgi:hypothetical protein